MAQPSTKTIKKGETISLYLLPASLAEATTPTRDLLSPYGFQYPGPEKYYGYALRDLRDYTQKMTGAKLPLTALDTKAQSGIFAGTFGEYSSFKSQTESGRKAINSDDPEAFVIEAQGGKLFVLGKTHFGLIAAVYTLLDHLGAKWFAPGEKWENVPRLGELAFEKLNMASSGPSYTSRLMFSNYGTNNGVADPNQREIDVILWMLRNRMGGSTYVQNAHNEDIIPRALFETNPEYFALITKGYRATQTVNNRFARELARHKPEVVNEAIKNVMKYFEENKGKGSTHQTFSLETGDGIPADEEGVEKFGNATDLNFWFANEIAKGLEAAGHKDKWLGILSYSDHSLVPSFDLHPQVSVVLTNGLAESKLTLEERLDGFRARKARRLGVYDYFNVASWTLGRPGGYAAYDPLKYAATLKRWHDHGARDYQAESTDSWGDAGPGNYLMARVLWNVNADAGKELDEYYQGAFGPSAGEIRALYDDWKKFYTRQMPRYGRDEVAYWHSLISQADAKAKSPLIKSRINDLKRYHLYINAWREFDMDVSGPNVPSREERFWKMTRYVAANRGAGAFHARGLTPTMFDLARNWKIPLDPEKMGPELTALAVNHNDPAALKALPVLDEAAIDRMFAEARLPLDDAPTDKSTLDLRPRVLQAENKGTGTLDFPRVYVSGGIAATAEFLIRVLQPTPRLSLTVNADMWNGGIAERELFLRDPSGKTIQTMRVKAGEPKTFEVQNAVPGLYTLLTASIGALDVRVEGAPMQGAMRGLKDTWGFNAMRPPGDNQKIISMYFLVPANMSTLHARLTQGKVDIEFEDKTKIVTGFQPDANNPVRELKFAPEDKPRVARVTWSGDQTYSIGFVLDEVSLYSLSPDAVFYESLN